MAKPLNVAAPLATVVAVALLNVAPAGPEAITAVTGTPAPPAGLSAPSRTWSTGCGLNAAPLAAVAGGSVVIVNWVAVPAPSVTVPEVAGVRLFFSNLRRPPRATPFPARPLFRSAPLATVVAVALLNVAPAGPVAITAVTVTPAPPTAFPAASRTWITGCGVNAAPLAAVAGGWVVIVSCAAAPAVAIAEKFTGDPAPVAWIVWVPAWVPSVHAVLAMPLALLVDVGGFTDPLPLAGVHVTVTPATGLLLASLTSTTCGVCSRVATCPVRLSPELFTSVAAAPAPSVIVPEVAVVSVPLSNRSV